MSTGFRHREEWQKQLCSSAQTRAARLYDHLDFLLEQKKQAEADLLREAKKHPIVRILETAPGFGPIRAARLVPIVVTPHRFRTKRQFWSYCGLGIVTRSSSDWVQTADGGWIKARIPQTRGLSRQHNRFLKHIFKGAATTVITQRNKDPIHARYERLLDGGTKPTLAKLSLARMIAATVLRMWKDEEEYDPGRAGLPITDTRRLGDGSIGRVDEKAVIRARTREESSHATLGVAAEASIPERPGQRPRASKGPTDKLCPSEEPKEAMADRGPDGRMVPTFTTWRTHTLMNRDAMDCALEPNLQTEPLVNVPQLLSAEPRARSLNSRPSS